MTHQLRLLAGGTGLAAGLWFLTTAVAAPVLPTATYKKTAEADIAQLQKHLAVIAETPEEGRRFGPTAKSMAMLLAAYGEATGDAEFKDQALKIAAETGELMKAVREKNLAQITKSAQTAGDMAKKLTLKPGAAPLKASGLEKMHKYNLEEVMSPFRGGKFGGMNIEKDIRDMIRKDMALPIDPAAVEILAVRTAVIGDYAVHYPNDKADTNAANKAKWEKMSKEMIDLSKTLSAEAAKGKGANEKELLKTLKLLDAKCVECHNQFRDD